MSGDPYFEGPGPGFVSPGMVWKIGCFEVHREMCSPAWSLRDARGAELGRYWFQYRAFRAAKLANSIAAAEREACAQTCEGHYDTAQAARAIRARGEV